MNRNFIYSALVLRAKNSGESNRNVWFLTAEEGIIQATVYGGPKSKLRAYISPFNQGRLYIYFDQGRSSRKVTDFDVRFWHPGLRELYERSSAASAVAGTVLASHGGGGNWESAFTMIGNTLNALDLAESSACIRILLHFLWNWTDILGLRPGISRCDSCGCGIPQDQSIWYSGAEGALCPSCAGREEYRQRKDNYAEETDGMILLGPGARRWLCTVQDLSPSLLPRYTLDKPSLRQVKNFISALLSSAFGTQLSLWEGLL
ncbi:MAG: recombination protein O N-terminal domain-containing protein [Treponema sp.]|jgi:DNA repair protein RecO (recombination protein O)|nr:recombination protein O N-terminal domain-containing protein [Treponema sp.]